MLYSIGNLAAEHACKENEEWRECASCEVKCTDPDTVPCVLMCKPPQCQCPADKGFRRDSHGDCIPKSKCPQATMLPVKQGEEHNCKKNEQWTRCGSCEGTCKQKLVPCPRICQEPRCECPLSRDFVRDDDGNCIKYDDCPKND